MRGVLLAAAVVFLGPTLAAFAVPLCSYQSPLTDLSDLGLSFSYEYHNDPYGDPDEDLSAGEFVANYVRLYDRPEYGFDVDIDTAMVIAERETLDYTVRADANFKWYLASQKNMFAFAGASARSSSLHASLGLTAGAGVGYGRFTDVTPLAIATRIDAYLVRRGSLIDNLHAVDLQILAYEISSAAEYESTADLLAVVQEIVEDSGLVREDGLDALDISEMMDLIEDPGYSRYCGWDAKIGLGFEVLDPSGGASDLVVTAALNYAFSTTPNAQFLVQGTLSGPPALAQQNTIDLSASYDYLAYEFLTLRAEYDFSRETWASEPTDVHRIAFNLAIAPVRTAGVVTGVVFEYRGPKKYTEWSVDVTLSIEIDLL
ncbi:MAG: hypothetical protein PHW86_04140 [Candidatus Bipolaricaulis sp.]|nr:hypothetical protein [Candidatus Bipolaricaulis sp.]